jgi:hypothetical protein
MKRREVSQERRLVTRKIIGIMPYPPPLPPAKFVQTIWDQLLTRKIFRDKELAMKITLARPLLPTLAGIGAGNSSHFSANYCEAPSLSKSKQASGLEDPRSGADARSVRGRAGILSRGLGVNVCEGCHRTFVRFFADEAPRTTSISSSHRTATPKFSLESVSEIEILRQLSACASSSTSRAHGKRTAFREKLAPIRRRWLRER